jgi:hypothetical protein
MARPNAKPKPAEKLSTVNVAIRETLETLLQRINIANKQNNHSLRQPPITCNPFHIFSLLEEV